jgi:hypothetical protein
MIRINTKNKQYSYTGYKLISYVGFNLIGLNRIFYGTRKKDILMIISILYDYYNILFNIINLYIIY